MNEHSKNTAGIFAKMIGQAFAFEALGHDVRLIYMSLNNITLSTMQPNGTLQLVRQFGPVAKEGERDKFWQLANEFVNAESWQVDILYARYDMMFEGRSFLDFLSDCKGKQIKVVVEFPTYPYALEIKDKADREIDANYVKDIGKYTDIIFSTSHQKYILNIKNVFFNNKIHIDPLRLSQVNGPLILESKQVNIFVVANFMFWHGMDRLLKGLASYVKADNNYNVVCHFVGGGEEVSALQLLTKQFAIEDNVIFHGFKSPDELSPFFDSATLCVGSLGLHRINIFESSVLKVREYLAHGLPIVIANRDEDLVGLEWAFSVPQNEEPVDIAALVNFAQQCDESVSIRHDIRQFAKQNLTWDSFAYCVISEVENVSSST